MRAVRRGKARPETAAETGGAELRLLGGFALRSAEGREIELPTRKACLLLAYLAAPAGTAHPREKLADLFWPESQADQARGSLRHALAAIRKALGPAAIDGRRGSVALAPGRLRTDSDALAALAKSARPADAETVARLAGGEFLAGFSAAGELGEWLRFERTRARSDAQSAYENVIEATMAQGRHEAAAERARALCALDPLRERSHRLLMRAYAGGGERAKAMEHFYRLKDMLAKELRAMPSPKTAALAREILDAAADAPALPKLRPIEAAPARLSLAVLPFAAPDGDADAAALAQGFAADLAAGLSRIAELSVVAWQSSGQMASGPDRAAASAATLGAQYAVAGNVRIAGGQVRIAAQLLSAANGEWIWADRFDFPRTDMFAVQDEIVERVLGRIDAGLRQGERVQAARRGLDNLDAWGLYHRGMWHMFRFTPEDIGAAERLFRQAAQAAPRAGAPLAGLAYAAIVRLLWHFTDDPARTAADGLGDARAAVAREPADANAQTMLGRLLAMAGDGAAALQHLALAIELNPSFAAAHYGMAQALYRDGRPREALPHAETALRLSPKDPLACMFLTMAALCHFLLGDLDAAEAAARRAASLQAKEIWSRLALAAVLGAKGRTREAKDAVAEARGIQPRLTLASLSDLLRHVPDRQKTALFARLRAAGLD